MMNSQSMTSDIQPFDEVTTGASKCLIAGYQDNVSLRHSTVFVNRFGERDTDDSIWRAWVSIRDCRPIQVMNPLMGKIAIVGLGELDESEEMEEDIFDGLAEEDEADGAETADKERQDGR